MGPKRPGPAEESLWGSRAVGGEPLKGGQQQPTALQVSPQQPTAAHSTANSR